MDSKHVATEDMRKAYEVLVIFPDSLRDDPFHRAVEAVQEEIRKLGGTVNGTEMMGRRAFAHPLKKRTSGQYVRVDFHLDPRQVEALSSRLKLQAEVFRFQIVKVWRGRKPTVSAPNKEPSHGQSQ